MHDLFLELVGGFYKSAYFLDEVVEGNPMQGMHIHCNKGTLPNSGAISISKHSQSDQYESPLVNHRLQVGAPQIIQSFGGSLFSRPCNKSVERLCMW